MSESGAVENASLQMPVIEIDPAGLSQLMPMHLHLTATGEILGVGPTMCKLIPDNCHTLSDGFMLTRPVALEDDLSTLIEAARGGERIFLRMLHPPELTLRGHVTELPDGTLLANLGFGIQLVEAVRALDLTDGDFAPADLAMELLFLHEANRAVMTELSRFNLLLAEAREAAEVQAFTDPLTGLYNRRGLEIALALALRGAEASRAQREHGEFALAHLDLDFFKEVNDRFGHAKGDEVLCRVAKILRQETRSNDTIARVGGDEFVILLTGASSPDALRSMGRRIINGIELPLVVDGQNCRVSASIGVAMSADFEVLSADHMLEAADAALYQSKHAGRGCATIHEKGSTRLPPLP